MEILPKGERYAALKQRLHFPMALLGVVWVVAIALELTLDPAHPAKRPLLYLDWVIWAIFLSEYLFFLFLAPDKRRYVRGHLLDIVIILLPAARVLRLGRSLVLLRSVAIIGETLHEAWKVLRRRKFHYLIVLNSAAIAAGSVLVNLFEGPLNPFFASYGNCLWWAFVTMASVGYGEMYPRTAPGKVIAVVLMLMGISLFSYFAASLASWFVEKDLALEEKQLDRLEKKVDDLLKKVETR
jgi:voltage-gated potassium channel